MSRAWAASMSSSMGGSQPVTLDPAVTVKQSGPGRGVELRDDIVDGEGPVGSALDEAPLAHSRPGQQVGVVLDHGGDHDVVRAETEPVDQMVDGLGGVATEDGHVGAVGSPAGEGQGGGPGRFVLVGRQPRLVSRAAVNAGVPREEVVHPGCDRGQGGGGGGGVEVDIRPCFAGDAGDGDPVADQGDRDPSALGRLGHGRRSVGCVSAWCRCGRRPNVRVAPRAGRRLGGRPRGRRATRPGWGSPARRAGVRPRGLRRR